MADRTVAPATYARISYGPIASSSSTTSSRSLAVNSAGRGNAALAVDHAVSRQRACQDGDGPVSERSAKVDAMNGSATEPSGRPREIHSGADRNPIPRAVRSPEFSDPKEHTTMSVTLTDQDKLTLRT
ncbi:hypothetical protein, partial [Nonomuraea dietziae]|uniref:hypothetical protein n=1 Tax=Nonomuraea dietziae TaxID=65515 RepID=UPI0036703341